MPPAPAPDPGLVLAAAAALLAAVVYLAYRLARRPPVPGEN